MAILPDDDEPKTYRDLAEAAIMDLRSYALDEGPERRLVSANAYEERLVILDQHFGVPVATSTITIPNPAEVTRLMRERHGSVGFYEGMTWSSEMWKARQEQRKAIEAELLALGKA